MAFDITSVLREVPDSGTGREQIEYIALNLIDDDAKNFYATDEIDSLARNIATIGLLDPLRIRDNPEAEGRYKVVSGHRRRPPKYGREEWWADARVFVMNYSHIVVNIHVIKNTVSFTFFCNHNNFI